MRYRDFGSTGFQVSVLGLGCMRLPTARFRAQKIDVPEANRLIRGAVDRGINYIDTAWPYHLGESERVVGQALQDGYRERVHLVTKLPLFIVRNPTDFDRFLDGQLRKLGTDHLDTYLFHAVNRGGLEKIKRLDLLNRMTAARDAGKIRYIGFSFHDVLPVFKQAVDLFPWDVVQIQYNYVDTGVQATTEGLRYAAQKGMAVVVMEPLKGGKLAAPPADARRIMDRAEVRRTPVDWALQFLWNLPEVSTVLSGMGSIRMLEENCASTDASGVGVLRESEIETLAQLRAAVERQVLVPCTACRYCMPCPFGVDIPGNFAIANNVHGESRAAMRFLSRRSYRKLAADKAHLNADRDNGRASMCTRCGACIPKCPQSIDIPSELARVEAIVRR